jgi:DNA-binding PadR family transcriptional regulator
VQEVVLAMLAKEPSHGYELRARLRNALGPLGEAMNHGQIYVVLGRLEKSGLVATERAEARPDRSDRKVYVLTAAGPAAGHPLVDAGEPAQARSGGTSPQADRCRRGQAR